MVTGILYGFGRDIIKVLVMGMLYGLVIIIVTMVTVAEYWDWLREYYTVLILIMEVFVTGIIHSFGNDNSKRRMSCSCIGMG